MAQRRRSCTGLVLLVRYVIGSISLVKFVDKMLGFLFMNGAITPAAAYREIYILLNDFAQQLHP